MLCLRAILCFYKNRIQGQGGTEHDKIVSTDDQANGSEGTFPTPHCSYLNAETGLGGFCKTSPEPITQEVIEDYLMHLTHEKGHAPASRSWY